MKDGPPALASTQKGGGRTVERLRIAIISQLSRADGCELIVNGKRGGEMGQGDK